MLNMDFETGAMPVEIDVDALLAAVGGPDAGGEVTVRAVGIRPVTSDETIVRQPSWGGVVAVEPADKAVRADLYPYRCGR